MLVVADDLVVGKDDALVAAADPPPVALRFPENVQPVDPLRLAIRAGLAYLTDPGLVPERECRAVDWPQAAGRRTSGDPDVVALQRLSNLAERLHSVGQIRQRKRWREFLSFLKILRARWPGGKLYVICDNYGPRQYPDVRTWAAGHNIELVYLPTSASWLNWIEAEFAALRYFALNGTDHHSHAEQAEAIAGYVRWRNARAEPKRDFAVDSVIRTWTDYQINVA